MLLLLLYVLIHAQARPVFPLVRCTTTKGDVEFEIRKDWSPHGAQRLFELVDAGFYTDIALFRMNTWIVQFGAVDRSEGGPLDILDGQKRSTRVREFTNTQIKDDPPTDCGGLCKKNRLFDGAVSFAGGGKDSRGDQIFFVHNLADQPIGHSLWETPVGNVTSGLDVIRSFYAGYGDFGVDQGKIMSEGAKYLRKFPRLDYIRSCEFIRREDSDTSEKETSKKEKTTTTTTTTTTTGEKKTEEDVREEDNNNVEIDFFHPEDVKQQRQKERQREDNTDDASPEEKDAEEIAEFAREKELRKKDTEAARKREEEKETKRKDEENAEREKKEKRKNEEENEKTESEKKNKAKDDSGYVDQYGQIVKDLNEDVRQTRLQREKRKRQREEQQRKERAEQAHEQKVGEKDETTEQKESENKKKPEKLARVRPERAQKDESAKEISQEKKSQPLPHYQLHSRPVASQAVPVDAHGHYHPHPPLNDPSLLGSRNEKDRGSYSDSVQLAFEAVSSASVPRETKTLNLPVLVGGCLLLFAIGLVIWLRIPTRLRKFHKRFRRKNGLR